MTLAGLLKNLRDRQWCCVESHESPGPIRRGASSKPAIPTETRIKNCKSSLSGVVNPFVHFDATIRSMSTIQQVRGAQARMRVAESALRVYVERPSNLPTDIPRYRQLADQLKAATDEYVASFLS